MGTEETPRTKRCEECGKPISRKRLGAVPGAIYCLECQEKYGKKTRPEDIWESLAPSAKIGAEHWGEK